MNTIYLNIAGFKLEIIFKKTEWILLKKKLKREILYQCSGFILKKKPKNIDYSIKIVARKLAEILELKMSRKNFINLYEKEGNNSIVTFYLISISQFILILKKILLELLTRSGGFLLHSSAAKIKGKVAIFLGRDEAGKSTIAKLIEKQFPTLSDDISIIKKYNNSYYFYQTPFIDKRVIVKNSRGLQIERIFFLKKANYFSLKRLDNKEAILRLLVKQIATDNKNFNLQLKYILDVINQNNFYILYFAKNSRHLIKLLSDEPSIDNSQSKF